MTIEYCFLVQSDLQFGKCFQNNNIFHTANSDLFLLMMTYLNNTLCHTSIFFFINYIFLYYSVLIQKVSLTNYFFNNIFYFFYTFSEVY